MLEIIIPKRHADNRGFFSEIFNKKSFLQHNIDHDFVQDNHSLSVAEYTLRGLHFQAPPHAQAKLVRCGRGAIFDVAVDIRKGSPTYGNWVGYELTADNGHQLYVPIGFAHGFVTLVENSEIVYKCSDYYAPDAEGSIFWNDPDLKIDWPIPHSPKLSQKDEIAPLLADFESPFIFGENS